MKAFEEKTLDEILLLEDQKSIEEYYKTLAELGSSRIIRPVVEKLEGKSINYIWQRVMSTEQSYTSNIIFPGDLIVVYPNIREQRARNFITCDFSGGIIYPGSIYINYRPLLDNISTGETFVLQRTIKVETGYYCDLPTSIGQFESLERRMQMELDYDGTGIGYSHLNQRMGGELGLQKLKRRKK